MDLTVVSYGSEGDTRPLVGLSAALQQAGHSVHLFAEQSSAHNAVKNGVPVSVLPGDIKATLPQKDPNVELKMAEVLHAIQLGIRVVNDNVPLWMRQISERARESDALLFAGLASPAAHAVATGLHKKAIGLWLQPTTPTNAFAAPTVPFRRMPGWLNRLSYRAGPEAVMRRLYGKSVDKAFSRQFGVSAGRVKPLAARLYAFSEQLVSRPPDWGSSEIVCGRWEQPAGQWTPSVELLKFLEDGERPVYVGFGAVSSFIRRKSLDVLIQALGNRRVIFNPGWSDISSAMLPEHFFVIGDTPHAWLFPRMSLIVHHAGAGTSHTAAASGVPSVVLPIGVDQPFWASRLHAIGIAPKPINGTKLEPRGLAEAIQMAESIQYRDAALKVAKRMSLEDGLGTAVRVVEQIVHHI